MAQKASKAPKIETHYKAVRRPWEFNRRADPLDSSGVDQRDKIPWDRRQWYLDCRAGRLIEIHQKWEGGVAVSTVQAPPPGSGEPFTRAEVEETFKVAEETECTIVEAALAVKGVASFAPDYVQQCLKSPRQCVAKVEKTVEQIREEMPDVKFVDPRIKARKKKRKSAKEKAAEPEKATEPASEEKQTTLS